MEDLEFKANVRGNQLQMQEKILVRAYHIELRAEYASLSFPPTPNEFLPNLTFDQRCQWANVVGWCTDEEDQKIIEELQKKYWDHADATGDFRIPRIRALFNGVHVPHPPGPMTNSRPECYKNPNFEFRHLCRLPIDSLPDSLVREDRWCRSRSRSPPPSRGKEPALAPDQDATPEDEGETSEDEVYWLESKRMHHVYDSGASSAGEFF